MTREKLEGERTGEEIDRKAAADKQPWHKPKVHRLQIEETASSPGSGGDLMGRATGGGGIPG